MYKSEAKTIKRPLASTIKSDLRPPVNKNNKMVA